MMRIQCLNEYASRFIHLVRKEKSCKGNCLTCEYFSECRDDFAVQKTKAVKRKGAYDEMRQMRQYERLRYIR